MECLAEAAYQYEQESKQENTDELESE
jgi:hypothetical protein